MLKRHPIMSTAVLVAVLGAALFAVFRPGQANSKQEEKEQVKKEDKKLPVEIAVAQKGDISNTILTTASLEPDKQVNVVSETNGIVDRILVDEGVVVREGQLIAQLVDREKQVALQKAQIRVQNAKIELDRKHASHSQKIISQAEYDKAKFEMEVAESEKKTAEVELERCVIRAPFSGIITERFVEKGQNIQPNTNLFALVDRDPLKAKVYLPEKEILGLLPNQEIEFALNSQKDVKFAGKIRQINPAVDSRTGTVKVTVEITAAPAVVRPGSFVDVKVETQRHKNTILIPKKAVVEDAGERFVYLINKGIAQRRIVEVGFNDAMNVEILDGIKPGDQVVIAGQGSLRDGTKAEVVAQLK